MQRDTQLKLPVISLKYFAHAWLSAVRRYVEMINNSTNSVEWALLIYELDDASEHLANLSRKMANQGAIDSEDFAIQLGHIYAHLNRAW